MKDKHPSGGFMTNARFASLSLLLASMVAVCAQGQTFSVLYDFGTKIGDPYQPYVEIVRQGRDGNLYSTASQGGANGGGAVYKITQAGAVKVLHSFSLQEGLLPFGGLTLGTSMISKSQEETEVSSCLEEKSLEA
jgi:uncharacterized repeat protein (TIGR03803 family)